MNKENLVIRPPIRPTNSGLSFDSVVIET